jgi:hypothetical protein
MDETLRTRPAPRRQGEGHAADRARDYTMTSDVVGTVVEYEQKQTGSWYAHSKNDKLWLDRLLIKKDDGELTTLNLDDYSHVEVLAAAPPPAARPARQRDRPAG